MLPDLTDRQTVNKDLVAKNTGYLSCSTESFFASLRPHLLLYEILPDLSNRQTPKSDHGAKHRLPIQQYGILLRWQPTKGPQVLHYGNVTVSDQ